MKKYFISAFFAVIFGIIALPAYAVTDCTFTTSGTTMNLDSDCTTDETIYVPDGYTLDGQNHTITAVDPSGDSFKGGVIENGGSVAYVVNLNIHGAFTTIACHVGADRLRGILFDGASGSITHNSVHGINQGASGCQEGNAIEVRNAPFDGTHPNTQTIEIAHNKIADWQKTGIVANGDVDVNTHHNSVDASATQANLAANSIQLGFGALGSVVFNHVEGNQWCGPSEFVATAVLLFASGNGVDVSLNNIGGNSDVGIYAFSNMTNIWNNKVFDDPAIPDCNAFGYDIGIGNYDIFLSGNADNTVTNNKVFGFGTPYDEVNGGQNKVIPGPNGPKTGEPYW